MECLGCALLPVICQSDLSVMEIYGAGVSPCYTEPALTDCCKPLSMCSTDLQSRYCCTWTTQSLVTAACARATVGAPCVLTHSSAAWHTMVMASKAELQARHAWAYEQGQRW